ncbi:transposase [Rivularia sp. PCC 7116]|uniref:REP-associated tyrosine transposase n=1 Tax=Rivularia sp. PCC 7116 TaxID=373994 RepID=UPI00029EF0C4|nr:transposase [Rivularia sp. PCC 7116]AFY55226.1 transposase [Rivularia sp. PCC 7116]
MGRSRYKFIENNPHFLTCTIVNWLPIFSQPEFAQIIIKSLDFLSGSQRLTLHAYVMMENHLHLIASSKNISKEIAAFKSFTARSIIDKLKQNQAEYLLKQLRFHKKLHKTSQEHQLWQEGSHPQTISTQEMLIQKLEYIHNNPIRRGYVDEPAHWRYSSYRNYMDMKGILNIDVLEI